MDDLQLCARRQYEIIHITCLFWRRVYVDEVYCCYIYRGDVTRHDKPNGYKEKNQRDRQRRN